MSEPFNVNQYWLERGRNYIHENFPQEFHRLQEQFLLNILRASGIATERLLELGCGFGRITRLLAQTFPHARITALDLSPEQLDQARHNCSEYPNVSFFQYDFYSGSPMPVSRCDAVIAVEVFLHHPRDLLLALVERFRNHAQHVINVDWSEP